MNITIDKSNITTYGVTIHEGKHVFVTSLKSNSSAGISLYSLKGDHLGTFDICEYKLAGNVYSFSVSGLPIDGFQYEYICDGDTVSDPFMRDHSLCRPYGMQKSSDESDRAVFKPDCYDWESDKRPELAYSDVISYELHVRGFTKHPSSKVKAKGCFAGIIEKIPYLTELGVNQIELMPAYDFYEIDSQLDDLPKDHPSFITEYTLDINGNVIKNLPKTKINYWGYKKASYFCPKKSYSYSSDATVEFKDMVKALHKAGIEVIMQMFFPKPVRGSLISECLKYWYMEYHVDGFRLMGERLPIGDILGDELLADAKMYINNLDRNSEEFINGACKKAANIDNRFLCSARKFLKSDSDSISSFVSSCRNNPNAPYNINYITCYEGFTLNDLVSYEYKHNEDNGENNTDGSDYNLSWNCGVEGKSTKKAVKELRIRQIKNALSLLLLSQGTPMLFMGDEMMNSQNGNNNPYCQDNEISWLNWKLSKSEEEILEFTKALIKLRKEHGVLHRETELKGMDYLSVGYPDISYHQDMAWKAEFDNGILHFAELLWGSYAKKYDGTTDEPLFIAYNMHWENHTFGLPKLKPGLKWEFVISTCSDAEKKKLITDLTNDEICVCKRSVVMLKVVADENNNNIVEQNKK